MSKYRIKTVKLKNGLVFHYPQEKELFFWKNFIKNLSIGGKPEFYVFLRKQDALSFLNKIVEESKNQGNSVESITYTPVYPYSSIGEK